MHPESIQQLCEKKYSFYHQDLDLYVKYKSDENGDKVISSISIANLVNNYKIIITHHFKYEIKYSIFNELYFVNNEKYSDRIKDTIRSQLETFFHQDITPKRTEQAIFEIGNNNSFDELQDYFNQFKNSEMPQVIDNNICQIFGVDNNIQNINLIKKFLVSGVARALQPGCKIEGTLILTERKGGERKSTLCEALCPNPDWFHASNIDIDDSREIAQTHTGVFIDELEELTSIMNNRKGLAGVKRFLSGKKEQYIPKYSNAKAIFLRRFICIGTTNSSSFLPDEELNRRFWCMKQINSSNIELLKQLLTQIWQEAYHLYQGGFEWWLNDQDKKLLSISNEHFVIGDSLVDHMKDVICNYENQEYIKSSDIMSNAKKFKSNISDNAVWNVMRGLGWKTDRKYIDGVRHRVWVREESKIEDKDIIWNEKPLYEVN